MTKRKMIIDDRHFEWVRTALGGACIWEGKTRHVVTPEALGVTHGMLTPGMVRKWIGHHILGVKTEMQQAKEKVGNPDEFYDY